MQIFTPFFLFILISIFIIIFLSSTTFLLFSNDLNQITTSIDTSSFTLNDSSFLWPVPGYTIITSKFGKRNAPTSGASTSHSGIDIAAPTGANIIAIFHGKITYLGFNGAGGYTIILENETFSASFCHVDPNFKVYVGQSIKKGQLIGCVGPKNVYDVLNNPYKDSAGNPTNGATTGPHLHLTLKKNKSLIDPLEYL